MDRVSLRLLLAQGADVITFLAFYLFVGPSIHAERNPLLLALMALGGVQLVAIVKIGITLLVVRRKPRSWAPLTIAMAAATASGIAGAGFNLAAIVDAMVRG